MSFLNSKQCLVIIFDGGFKALWLITFSSFSWIFGEFFVFLGIFKAFLYFLKNYRNFWNYDNHFFFMFEFQNILEIFSQNHYLKIFSVTTAPDEPPFSMVWPIANRSYTFYSTTFGAVLISTYMTQLNSLVHDLLDYPCGLDLSNPTQPVVRWIILAVWTWSGLARLGIQSVGYLCRPDLIKPDRFWAIWSKIC